MRRYRFVFAWAAVAAAFALVAAGCGGDDDDETAAEDVGDVLFFSSQLAPVEEAEQVRNVLLADVEGNVEFVPSDEEGSFVDRVLAEARSGQGRVDLLGALHGTFVTFEDEDVLIDLSDVAEELADLGIPEDLLELGKLGTDQQLYIPWINATYVGAANKQVLEMLPEGADIDNLTWDEFRDWARNIEEETGSARLGLPAGEDGLIHRFFQGYLVPAYSGGVVTTFASDDAKAGWQYLTDLWQHVHPQSTVYGFMQDPLLSEEVLLAWDHTARLKTAFEMRPDDFVAFPVPAGPRGRAYMPVVAGLGIPKTAPNPDGAKALIKHLLSGDVQAKTLASVGFFPVITQGLAEAELSPGLQVEADAVTKQGQASDALPSLLPIGLGDLGGDFNEVYRETFEQIVLRGQPIDQVVSEQAGKLSSIMEQTGAPCWAPDPPSEGACQVGG